MRALLSAVVAVGLVVGPTSLAAAKEEVVQGRHAILGAGMYATVIDTGHPIQMLDELCPKPGKRQGCEPVLVSLKRALEDVVAVPIRWVPRERNHAGRFYSFSAVDRNGSRARFNYRWDDPGPLGCNGQGDVRFRRIDWTGWRLSGGRGVVGCAVAGTGHSDAVRPSRTRCRDADGCLSLRGRTPIGRRT